MADMPWPGQSSIKQSIKASAPPVLCKNLTEREGIGEHFLMGHSHGISVQSPAVWGWWHKGWALGIEPGCKKIKIGMTQLVEMR